MRKLASVRQIVDIQLIEDADAIELAIVDGWKCVIKKNEFNIGDLVIYIEVDSWVPHELAPFLSKGQEPREFDGVLGNRLRTVKLRGQISQGLLLPLSKEKNEFKYEHPYAALEILNGNVACVKLGDDVTDLLKIKKWEPAVPAQLAGEVSGKLSSKIPITDEERIQNLASEIGSLIAGHTFEKTIKLDGASMTVFHENGIHGVAGRNWIYRDKGDNTFWRVAKKNNLVEALMSYGKNIALRGELIGEGIQENNEKIKGHDFYLFNIWDIDNQKYLDPETRDKTVCELNRIGANIKQVPSEGFVTFNKDVTVEDILALADGKSLFAKNREGIVFKRVDGNFSFKAISNWYLLKHGNR